MAPFCLDQPSGRYLSLAEREEIAVLRGHVSVREIARRLGRAPSTVSRELARNSPVKAHLYRATSAQARAEVRARRPKVPKLADPANTALREYVQDGLSAPNRWSPRQIQHRVRVDFPHDERMRVSHETIYQSLYVQGRGALRRELHTCLRTGRALRTPHQRTTGPGRANHVPAALLISQRPAEVADRAVPGHWEGDLIIGKNSGSAIGTLVERATRYVLLLHLPDQHSAEAVRDAMVDTITTLPAHLRRTLTWDQGVELAKHGDIRIATGLDIYFCDPHSPWQRGSNENTNGLLRQYFPKGTDLSVHTRQDLDTVAAALNGRPRQTLGWANPAEKMAALLSTPQPQPVATTT
jgi:IS30 family transposase